MFSIFKKSKSVATDLSGLVTDMHSHLLPGIDDGSPDVETSDILIKGLLDLGYKKLITTPHVMSDLYPNTESTIDSSFKNLKQHSSVSRVSFPLQYAAEYFLDEHFDKLLKDGKELLCITNKVVLVEFSFVAPPGDYKSKIFELQIQGYQPVLAHPERYLYFAGNKLIFDELKTIGCRFAVNLLSFTGYYGKPAADLANYFIKKNYIDLVGTDLHHPRHLDSLRNAPQLESVVKGLLDKGNLMNPKL